MEVFLLGFEARDGGLDFAGEEFEARAEVGAFAGERDDGAAGEVSAEVVGELRRLEVATGEREPGADVPDGAVGLVAAPGIRIRIQRHAPGLADAVVGNARAVGG